MTSLAMPSPLVGRDRELSILRHHLDAALGGHGGLLLIGGEVGIGKTALADALCRDAVKQGALVLVGRCYDLTETPPYGPWVELVARYQPKIDDPPIPAAFAQRGTVGAVPSQPALLQQVEVFFRELTKRCPLVVLLDDLHWTDPASLDLLRFLARNLADCRLLLVVTYRSDEVARDHPLHHLLPLLVREGGAERLDLHPLDTVVIRALIDQRYHLSAVDADRLVAYLHTRAEGNPLFLGELLRALEESSVLAWREDGWILGPLTDAGVPPLLRQVVDGRVARLAADSQRLLAVAAVIGQTVSFDLCRSVGERDEVALLDAVAEAQAAHIVAETDDGTGATFTHALIREAVYAAIRPSHRRALHRQVGEALIAKSDVPDPDTVAYHFHQAGDARAAAWLIKAGDRAERAHAWQTAALRFEAALAQTSSAVADAAQRGWLLWRMAWLWRFAEPQRAIAPLDEAERLGGVADVPLLCAWAIFTRGVMRCRTHDYRRGLRDLATCVAALEALPRAARVRPESQDDPEDLVDDWRAMLALWLAHAGRYSDAFAEAQRITVRDARNHDTGGWERRRYPTVFWALGQVYAALGRPAEAWEAFERVRAGDRAIISRAALGQMTTNALQWVAVPYYADRVTTCQRLAAEAEQAWRVDSGGLHPDDLPRLVYLPLLLLAGQWHEAWQIAFAAHAAPITEQRRLVAVRVLGQLARYRGDPALAWRLVHEWLPEGPALEPGNLPFLDMLALLRLAIALALDEGDLPTGHRWLETYDAWLAWSGALFGQAEGGMGWARYYRLAGDAARATDHAMRALHHATDPRQPLALLTTHRLLGALDADAGRFADAAVHFDEALTLAAACAAPFERARTLLAVASLQVATGNSADAFLLLGEVRAICAPLGALPTLAQANALTASLAATADQYPAGLSAREVEVLRLMASGCTNRQIADVLGLSERTIHAHVRTILTKTATENRAAATAFALRHALA